MHPDESGRDDRKLIIKKDNWGDLKPFGWDEEARVDSVGTSGHFIFEQLDELHFRISVAEYPDQALIMEGDGTIKLSSNIDSDQAAWKVM